MAYSAMLLLGTLEEIVRAKAHTSYFAHPHAKAWVMYNGLIMVGLEITPCFCAENSINVEMGFSPDVLSTRPKLSTG